MSSTFGRLVVAETSVKSSSHNDAVSSAEFVTDNSHEKTAALANRPPATSTFQSYEVASAEYALVIDALGVKNKPLLASDS